LNLNLPQKPKWHLELMIGNGYSKTTLNLLDLNGINIEHKIELVDIRTVSLFRVRYEEIIDEMLKTQILSAPTFNSHSIGITTNGNNIVYTNATGTTYTQASLVDTIKELQKQIDELKQNTPTNPF
jgi:hypothetical protein